MSHSRIPSYQPTCFTPYAETLSTHSNKIAIIYLFALGFFIFAMSHKTFDLPTKGIIGYSYLGALAIMLAIYIPYRKEMARQKAFAAEREAAAQQQVAADRAEAIRKLQPQIQAATDKLLGCLGNTETWPDLQITNQNPHDLQFDPLDLTSRAMKGKTPCGHDFYAIKVQRKDGPGEPCVFTFSQRGLISGKDSNCPEWYCLGGRDASSVFNDSKYYHFTSASENAQARFDALKQLFAETHPTHQLVN